MAFDLDDDELRETRRMKNLDRDLTVGEYGRTNLGKIIKFAWLVDSDGKIVENKVILISGNKVSNDFYYFHAGEKIVKQSKQLIDLIEVGDIIKYRIDNVSTTLETKGYIEGIVDIADEEMLQKIKSDKNYNILEILIKEQYMANCYKVGGKNK